MLGDAADLGERIIRAGMARFPNQPFLLILYANFLMEVGHEGAFHSTKPHNTGH